MRKITQRRSLRALETWRLEVPATVLAHDNEVTAPPLRMTAYVTSRRNGSLILWRWRPCRRDANDLKRS
jgi:hypothetical protein